MANYILIPTINLVDYPQFRNCRRLKDGRTVLPMAAIKTMQGIIAEMEIVDTQTLEELERYEPETVVEAEKTEETPSEVTEETPNEETETDEAETEEATEVPTEGESAEETETESITDNKEDEE